MFGKKSTSIVIATLVTISLSISEASAAAGDLDLTFGTSGKVTTYFSGDDSAASIALQSNGNIVVAGNMYNGNNYDFAVTRYNSDGTLDTSFSLDGKVTTDFGGDDYGTSVAIQGDGKIVVTGYGSSGGNDDFAIARYNTDGSLDTSFDTDGKLLIDFGRYENGKALAIQTDGKIVLAGTSVASGGLAANMHLLRLNTNGSLDTTFDSDGKVTTDIGPNDDALSIALQNDGKIIIGGVSDASGSLETTLIRYNSNGSLDTTFNSDGIATIDFAMGNDAAYSVAIQSDGKIIAAGYADLGGQVVFAIIRLNSNGSLDTTFDSDGKVSTSFGSFYDAATSVVIQNDGKIITAGISLNGGMYNFAIARYNTNGSLDTTFDTDGKITTAFGSSDDGANAIAIQNDGKIVAAGYSDSGSGYVFALARYIGSESALPDAPVINSITAGDRKLSLSFTAGASNGSAITDYEYSLNGSGYISAGTTTSPLSITNLSGRTSYSVVIKARNSAGLSTASNSFSAKTIDALLDASEARDRELALISAYQGKVALQLSEKLGALFSELKFVLSQLSALLKTLYLIVLKI
jgi:uncharacterized delta-60 repeat protein